MIRRQFIVRAGTIDPNWAAQIAPYQMSHHLPPLAQLYFKVINFGDQDISVYMVEISDQAAEPLSRVAQVFDHSYPFLTVEDSDFSQGVNRSNSFPAFVSVGGMSLNFLVEVSSEGVFEAKVYFDQVVRAPITANAVLLFEAPSGEPITVKAWKIPPITTRDLLKLAVGTSGSVLFGRSFDGSEESFGCNGFDKLKAG